jgi:hypothetical protein
MGKLWIFGDSFSVGRGMEDTHSYAKLKQKEFGVDSVWNLTWENLLSEELNLELVRRARDGASNSDIILSIIKDINNFKKDDCIIVGWSIPTRVSLPSPNPHSFEQISIQNYKAAKEFDKRFKTTNYYDFYIKTFFPNINIHCKFWTEIGEQLLIHLKETHNVKSWYWPEYYSDIHTIDSETNDEIQDGHPSVIGHSYLKEIIKSIPWGELEHSNLKFYGDGVKFDENGNVVERSLL